MLMTRMLVTIATLAALSLAPVFRARADSTPADRGQQTGNPSMSGQSGTGERDGSVYGGEQGSPADPYAASVQALTAPPARSDESGARIVPYPHEAPGYESGQTRPFGSSGGQ